MQALEPVLGGDCHFTPEDPGDLTSEPDGPAALKLTKKTRALLCQYLSSRLLEGVAESQAVLLLQTPSAYTDALTLLELYWAIRQKKTIICLRLQDSPYDFSEVLALSHQSPNRSQSPPHSKPPQHCNTSQHCSTAALHTATLQPSQMSRFLGDLEANLVRTSPATAELVGAWLDENMISFQHMAKSLAEHIPAVLTLPVAFSPGASENGIAATLEDIAMRLHREHHVTFPPVTPKSSSTSSSRPSLGSVLVHSVQGFSKEFSVSHGVHLHAAAHGKRAAQRMSILTLTATFLTALWRGHLARQHTARMRGMRDASILIAFHVRGWRRRRNQHMAVEQEQEQKQEQSVASQMARQMALSRLRNARITEMKKLTNLPSFGDDGDELDTMFALLIMSAYARCWLNCRATKRAASRRQAVEEAAVVAVAEEERLKKASMEPVAITPKMHQAKQHMRTRRLERAETAPLHVTEANGHAGD